MGDAESVDEVMNGDCIEIGFGTDRPYVTWAVTTALTVGVGGHYTRLSATWRKPPQPLENTRFNQVGTGLAFFSAPACPVPRAGYSG